MGVIAELWLGTCWHWSELSGWGECNAQGCRQEFTGGVSSIVMP